MKMCCCTSYCYWFGYSNGPKYCKCDNNQCSSALCVAQSAAWAQCAHTY